MEAQSRTLEAEGRAALDGHPLNPGRAGHLPREVRDALVADYALHSVRGVACTGLYTVPRCSVRERAAHTTVPTLLVTGERERGFAEARAFAEATIPGLQIESLDAGHAVNAEAADEFNHAVTKFILANIPA
jgi:pimeloyl-ACP methyl ester carboxylesterase